MENYCLSVIIEMLNPNNTLSVNRLLAHGIGLVEAIVYAILIAKQSYYNANGMLYEDGWFYSTVPDMQESTTLGEKAQRSAIKHLIAHGLIECEKKGLPARRFFRVVNDCERLITILEEGRRISEGFRMVGGKNSMRAGNAEDDNDRRLPPSTEECVEKMLNTQRKNPENDVFSSYRLAAGTSSRPAQDKTKVNKNQSNNIFGDPINPRAENSESPPVDENVDFTFEYSRMLSDIGLNWYDITAIEPDREEYFSERDEGSRFTRRCTLPYALMRDRGKLIAALKYVLCFSYYCGCDEDGNKNTAEAAFCNSVLDCLADIMTHDSSNLAGQRVMYYQVFDKINQLIRSGSLYEFINDFRDHWDITLSRVHVFYKRKYMRSCVWNYLNDYEIEKYSVLISEKGGYKNARKGT